MFVLLSGKEEECAICTEAEQNSLMWSVPNIPSHTHDTQVIRMSVPVRQPQSATDASDGTHSSTQKEKWKLHYCWQWIIRLSVPLWLCACKDHLHNVAVQGLHSGGPRNLKRCQHVDKIGSTAEEAEAWITKQMREQWGMLFRVEIWASFSGQQR